MNRVPCRDVPCRDAVAGALMLLLHASVLNCRFRINPSIVLSGPNPPTNNQIPITTTSPPICHFLLATSARSGEIPCIAKINRECSVQGLSADTIARHEGDPRQAGLAGKLDLRRRKLRKLRKPRKPRRVPCSSIASNPYAELPCLESLIVEMLNWQPTTFSPPPSVVVGAFEKQSCWILEEKALLILQLQSACTRLLVICSPRRSTASEQRQRLLMLSVICNQKPSFVTTRE